MSQVESQTSAPRDVVANTERATSEQRLVADVVIAGVAVNAETTFQFHSRLAPLLTVQQSMVSLVDCASKAAAGDLAAAEAMLAAQAVTLNAIFNELAQRAGRNLEGKNLQRGEAFMRMALKAQSQARCTVETLANIKQGPTIFARQANIAHGGPQQVNNKFAAKSARERNRREPFDHSAARPRERSKPDQTQLLETCDGERMDSGKTRTTSRAHPDLETVGGFNGSANAGGKGEVGNARRKGRAVEARARDASRPAGRTG